MSAYLLGIDIGTSACKVMLCDKYKAQVYLADGQYNTYRFEKGWVEQNPDEWWSVLCETIRKVLHESHVDPSDIRAIGVAGQSWSAIPVNKEGSVLYNTPIWMDTRSAEICDETIRKFGSDQIFEVSGNPFQPTYTTPKILWLKKYKPDIYKETHKILQSNSFIVYKMTGVYSQDMSQAYGLHCFNMREGRIDTDMCEAFGIKPDLIPDLYHCHQVVGTVTKKASNETGLSAGTPVVAGGLDAACATLGAGVMEDGQTQVQGGQAGGMSICIADYHAVKELILSPHVIPNRWLLQGGTVGGAGVLKWFETEFCLHERTRALERKCSSFQIMNEEAEQVSPGSDGLVFLPYMSGERSPIWDDQAKGVFYGVDFSKTRAHFIRACMEGVAYSLLHNLVVAKNAGVEASTLYSVGGAANSSVWNQIKADITGKEVVVADTTGGTSLGAIMLAGVGTGMYKDFAEAVQIHSSLGASFYPNSGNREVYKSGYETYLALYPHLKEIMHK